MPLRHTCQKGKEIVSFSGSEDLGLPDIGLTVTHWVRGYQEVRGRELTRQLFWVQYLAPVADKHKRRPVKRRTVFLSGDHRELSIAHRRGRRGAVGICRRRSQESFVEVRHQISSGFVCNRP